MPVGEATVSITDDGFLRGDGAFEMLKLYDGRPFGIDDHLDRLDRSAQGIFLEYDRPTFEREIDALLEANGQHDAALRLVLTRGGRRIAIVEPLPDFQHGLTLSGVRYQPTIVLNGLKTLSYGGNMRATRLAQRDGADEALLVDPDGTVLEAPTSTLFWVDADGNLHTPELDAGVLASITRERIMRLVPVTETAHCKLDGRAGRDGGVPRVVAARGAGRLVARRARVHVPGPGHAAGRGPAGGAHPGRAHGRTQPRGRMNLDLTDEQRLIRETAREFADREIIPRARDNDRAERFDLELVKRIAEMGYLGAPVAEEYGGRSLDYISYGLVVEEIGRGDSSARTVVSVQTSLVAGSIEQWGTEEQKQRSCRSSARASGSAASG